MLIGKQGSPGKQLLISPRTILAQIRQADRTIRKAASHMSRRGTRAHRLIVHNLDKSSSGKNTTGRIIEMLINSKARQATGGLITNQRGQA